MHYIFIDYENVQPAHLTPLFDVQCEIYIFVGARQTKLPLKLVTQMQILGDRAKLIPIATSAKDALDFHIAYYIGQVAAADRSGVFHIISNDKGYDPLITHLTGQNISISRKGFRRPRPQGNTPAPTAAPDDDKAERRLGTQEKLEKIKSRLKDSQPTTEKKLFNLVKNQFPTSKDVEVQNLINCLRNKKFIAGRNADITYPALAS